jgi:DNA-binding GntR family transcriptional regulator
MKLSQIAYARFKDGLLTGRIRAGATLSQSALSGLLDVPVGPLREAVQILEFEGLLTVMPRSGIRIAKPDLAAIRDAFQLRRLLEREAAGHFAAHAHTATLDRLRQAHDNLLAETEQAPHDAALWARARAVDLDLHRTLVQGLRNPLITATFERVHAQISLVRLDMEYQLSATLIRRTMTEHLAIIAALRQGDPDAATAAMDTHLTQAMHRHMWL